jgi:hypothetical protein
MMSAPLAKHGARLIQILHLTDHEPARFLDRRDKGAASPKDSMTAAGERRNARSSASGRCANAQVMKPHPIRWVARRRQLAFEPFRLGIAAADQAEPAGGADRGGQRAARDKPHRRQQHRVADAELIGEPGAQRHLRPAIQPGAAGNQSPRT